MKQLGKKSNSSYEQGYIYAPYIIVNKPVIIEGDISKHMLRRWEIRKRNEKIEKIKNHIENN